MADIFISYSSKDRAQAEQLTELLSSAGLSVWIDKQGIDVATSWSKEIVQAIERCKAFVVLLSRSSIESVNVTREVLLASQKKKKILPLDLEPVALSEDLQYHLAGIQRAPMTNIDSIIRALGKLGLEATQAPTIKLVKETGDKKSLMILPFEDLSPTGDNEWFADGLASEMISKLSHIKSLRLIDWNTSKLLKERKLKTTDLAREFDVRYFIEGQVRKFGDQIKISVTLLDIENGDYLWQDSLRGEMKDIFDIQDEVAEKVVNGLKLHITSAELKKLTEHGTKNEDAYAFAIKARDYNNLYTRESLHFGAKLAQDAIELDKNYAYAYYVKAFALYGLFENYGDPTLAQESESLARHALHLNPDFYLSYQILTFLYERQNNPAMAEDTAQKYIRLAPEDFRSHYALGTVYSNMNRWPLAISAYERALELKPDFVTGYFSICNAYRKINDFEVLLKWAHAGLPHVEKHLRLSPENQAVRQTYAFLLMCVGNRKEALAQLEALISRKDTDPWTLYNIADMLSERFVPPEPARALEVLRRSVEQGFSNITSLELWRDDDWVRANAAYAQEVEDIIALAQENEVKANLHG